MTTLEVCSYGHPPCGTGPARLYMPGRRCVSHTPAKLAGQAEADSAAYCAPARCYCGSCPSFVPIEQRATNTPDSFTAFDRRAVLSSTGRRTNLAEYRAAQEAKR